MKNADIALAKFFLACANQVLKGGVKTEGQSAMVDMFLECALVSIKK